MNGLTYNDVFVEEIVVRQLYPFMKPIRWIAYFMTLLCGVLFVTALPAVTRIPLVVCTLLCLFIGFGFLSFYYSNHLLVEFEYTITNREMELFVIYAHRKRKLLLSFQLDDIVVCAHSMSKRVRSYAGSGMRTFDCTSRIEGIPFYTLIYFDKRRNENRRVFWEPGNTLLAELKRQLPQKIYTDLEGEEDGRETEQNIEGIVR